MPAGGGYFPDGFSKLTLGPRNEDNRGTRRGKRAGEGPAEAAPSSGDDGDLAGKVDLVLICPGVQFFFLFWREWIASGVSRIC
jgi:hypothetical protein